MNVFVAPRNLVIRKWRAKCHVYGLFSRKSGRCEYVGLAENLSARLRHHKRSDKIKEPFIGRKLKTVKWSDGPKTERDFILKYKAVGQAAFNKNVPMTIRGILILRNIRAKKSFWVATESERTAAMISASILKYPYKSTSDDRGGFYVCHLPKVAKRKGHAK